jgi:hypothetical protein
MSIIKFNIALLLIFLFTTSVVKSQSYETAVGIRIGGLSDGITLKHFISHSSAVEGILSIGNRTFIVTGLYELHTAVDHSHLFFLYYGAGAHIGFFQDGGYYYYHNNLVYTRESVFGIDGIIGLGYKFKTVPINVGMDFKPFIDFNNGSKMFFDGGLSIRYTF